VNLKHTLGFLAGGYKNVAALKGIVLPEVRQVVRYQSMLIGWDAADWNAMNPLLQQGKLPGVAALMSQGVHSKLATLDPPISPMLWTSVATSAWPSKHGIHGFTELYNGQIRAVRGSSINVPTYFDYLESEGIPASSVAWWPSHPAKESSCGAFRISNLAVSEDLHWMEEGVTPNEYQQILKALILQPKDIPSAAVAQFFPNLDLDSKDDVVRSVLKITTHALNVQLLATFALDYGTGGHASIYFDALDHYKHLGMKYAPPQLKGVSDADYQKYQHIVESAYRLHDLCLQGLLDRLARNGSAILISDHGFVSGKERTIALPEHAGAPALEHKFHGIFVAKGPLFKDEMVWKGLNLLDIGPIVLATHNLYAPSSMSGVVPIKFSGKPIEIKSIQKEPSAKEGYAGDEELLQSLIDLGYLEQNQVSGEQGRLLENQYYLARSLRAEKRLSESWRLIAKMIHGDDVPERYLQLAASVLADAGNFNELERMLSKVTNQSNLIWSYYRSLVELNNGKQVLLPENLTNRCSEEVIILWGKLLLKSGAFDELEELVSNPEHESVDMWNLRARVFMLTEHWEKSLDAALQSAGLLFFQPAIHGIAAVSFSKLGMHDEAKTAKALQRKMLLDEHDETLFIVTGPPRSGTSMAMQLLEACGIPAVTDRVRKSNVFNSRGFYEHEKLRSWTVDEEWLNAQRGKAIKIVEPLIQDAPLPRGKKVVVRMKRSLDQLLQSQRRMKGQEALPLGLNEKMNWEETFKKTSLILALDPHIFIVELDYNELVSAVEQDRINASLAKGLHKLSKAVGKKVDISLLKSVISPQLRSF
jgi:predicted AlkP superfamily phosphohydrolase/phosphomutase